MPTFSAPDALQLLRSKELDVPFIIVSGSIGEESAVAAMKAGAQDYLVKGQLARLPAAIERELRDAGERRARKEAEQKIRYLAYFDPLQADQRAQRDFCDVSLAAYRTRELERAFPELGAGSGDRKRWETDPAWQGTRKAVELALIAYDWAESFTAVQLVLRPTLDDVWLWQLRRAGTRARRTATCWFSSAARRGLELRRVTH